MAGFHAASWHDVQPKRVAETVSKNRKAKLDALKDQPAVIGYCRGPWCLKAKLGVEALNQRGIPAKRLRAGVVEWQAAGLSLTCDPQTLRLPARSIQLLK